MRLFGLEMKKIFSWKLLLLIGVVNFLLFYLLLEFDLEYFPNGPGDTNLFEIEQQLIPEYGARIDENEFEEIEAIYADRLDAADSFFENDEQAQQLGITSYEEFQGIRFDDSKTEDYAEKLMFEKSEDFLWELQAWRLLVDNFGTEPVSLEARAEQTTGSTQQHYKQQLSQDQFAFYSSVVLDNFYSYETNMAIIILISVAMLMSPVFLRDTRSGLLPHQYTSKVGRRAYRIKWLAGISSTIILTIVLLGLYMGLYWTNGTASHFGLLLSSFGWYEYWYDMTFLQYIFLSIAAIFFVAVLLGILSMAISTVVPNAIILIGSQIVVLFIMIAGVVMFLIRDIIVIYFPQIFVPTGYVFLVAAIGGISWWIWRRELRRDIV